MSIINPSLGLIHKPLLTGSSKTAVDCAIVVILTSVLSNLLKQIGSINLNIRSCDDTVQYKLPKYDSIRPGKLIIECQVIYRNKWIKKRLLSCGQLEVAIKNTDWTSLSVNKRSFYEDINDDNPSEEIILKLKDEHKKYLEILITSNVDIKKDDCIKLEVRHSNKIINALLDLLFNINSNNLDIVYRLEKDI